MAKQRPKRKRRVPTVKLDDMQKTTNDNLDTAVRSFEGTTRVMQEIAKQMVDYPRPEVGQDVGKRNGQYGAAKASSRRMWSSGNSASSIAQLPQAAAPTSPLDVDAQLSGGR